MRSLSLFLPVFVLVALFSNKLWTKSSNFQHNAALEFPLALCNGLDQWYGVICSCVGCILLSFQVFGVSNWLSTVSISSQYCLFNQVSLSGYLARCGWSLAVAISVFQVVSNVWHVPSCFNLANWKSSPSAAAIWQQLSPVGSFSGDGESMLHSQYHPELALSRVFLDLMKATISTKTSLDDSSKINEDTNVNA